MSDTLAMAMLENSLTVSACCSAFADSVTDFHGPNGTARNRHRSVGKVEMADWGLTQA